MVSVVMASLVAVTFDPTISLGNLIAGAVAALTVLISYGRLARQIGAIETKVEAMWSAFILSRRQP